MLTASEQLRARRRTMRMTRAQAALRAGVTVAEWRSLERGDHTTDAGRVRAALGTLERASSRSLTIGQWTADDRVRDVLDNGDPFYVAVATPGGVHVVPVNFTRQADRIWLFSMRGSLKSRAIRRDPTVGGLVRRGNRAVMLTGRARMVDFPTARGLAPGRLLRLPTAISSYAVRNIKPIAGMALYPPFSPSLGLMTSIPVCIDIQRLALLEGDQVLAAWGEWPQQARATAAIDGVTATRPPGLHRLPTRLHPLLLEAGRPAVLGWDSAAGPVALPAIWQGPTRSLETTPSAVTLAGANPTARISAVVDRYSWRFKDHEGVLMAGLGHLTIDGDTARARIDHRRLTWWHKDEHDTVWQAVDRANGGFC